MSNVIRESMQDFLDNENLKELLDNLVDVLFRTTLDGTIIYINQAGLNLFGIKKTDEVEVNVLNFYENTNDRMVFINKLIQDGEVTNFKTRLKYNSKVFIVHLNAKVTYTDKDTYIDGTIHNITNIVKLKKKEAELDQEMKIIGNLCNEISQPIQIILGGMSIFKRDIENGHYNPDLKLCTTILKQTNILTKIFKRLQYTNTYKTKQYLKKKTVAMKLFNTDIE